MSWTLEFKNNNLQNISLIYKTYYIISITNL